MAQPESDPARRFPAAREVLEENFARLVTRRIGFLPIPLLMLGLVVFFETETWRRVAIAAAAVMFTTLSLADLRNVRIARRRPNAPSVNLAIIGLVQPLLVFSTGGLESPILPVLPVFAVAIGLFAPAPLRLTLLGLQVAIVWTMVAVRFAGWVPSFVPELLGGDTGGHSRTYAVLTACVVTMLLGLATVAGHKLRGLFGDVIARELAARDEALQTHREQTRTLTTLSAEIAHELKNPLASVKGLAALVSKELDGKPAERMAVLRRETDRMQEILDGFLNFSRPLTPLALEQVDLQSLAEGVIALHEGMAREKHIPLSVVPAPSPVVARCDRRKIHQVLINLLQNALEASPTGQSIELHALQDGRGARLEVRDRGPGLSAELTERIFESGVTTRPSGSGLGLTIARGLVRQHGGKLELLPRLGGGTTAVVTLPAERSAEMEKSA